MCSIIFRSEHGRDKPIAWVLTTAPLHRSVAKVTKFANDGRAKGALVIYSIAGRRRR